MKKIISLFLLVFVVLAFTGCDENSLREHSRERAQKVNVPKEWQEARAELNQHFSLNNFSYEDFMMFVTKAKKNPSLTPEKVLSYDQSFNPSEVLLFIDNDGSYVPASYANAFVKMKFSNVESYSRDFVKFSSEALEIALCYRNNITLEQVKANYREGYTLSLIKDNIKDWKLDPKVFTAYDQWFDSRNVYALIENDIMPDVANDYLKCLKEYWPRVMNETWTGDHDNRCMDLIFGWHENKMTPVKLRKLVEEDSQFRKELNKSLPEVRIDTGDFNLLKHSKCPLSYVASFIKICKRYDISYNHRSDYIESIVKLHKRGVSLAEVEKECRQRFVRYGLGID